MRWARMFSAASSTLMIGSTSDCDGQDQDRRIRRIDLAIGRRARQVLGQLAGGGVDRGLDVVGGGVDIAVEIELHGDRGRAERARRGHLRDAGNLGDLALERLGDRGGHRLRRGAGQRGADRNGGKVDLRQRRDRQQRIGDEADQQHRRHQQRRRDRPMNERSGNAAVMAELPLAVESTLTCVPGCNRKRLVVMTRSPSFNPSETTATSMFWRDGFRTSLTRTINYAGQQMGLFKDVKGKPAAETMFAKVWSR